MRVTATRLNVRSGPGTEFRAIGQLVEGSAVDSLESHGDWLWVAPGGGWVHRAYVEATSPRQAPSGLNGIRLIFGEPGASPCFAGRARFPHPLKLSWNNDRISVFACHILLEETFTRVFRRIDEKGLWPEVKEWGGCFNDRPTRQGGKASTHSWGIAADLNPRENAQGTNGKMHPGIIEIFQDEGFEWGGVWSPTSRDPMHFQYAKGY